MINRVVKNKKVSDCSYCGKPITTDYKVREQYNEHRNRKHYHLTCFNKMVSSSIMGYKKALSELHKNKRKLNRFKRYMILENLQ